MCGPKPQLTRPMKQLVVLEAGGSGRRHKDTAKRLPVTPGAAIPTTMLQRASAARHNKMASAAGKGMAGAASKDRGR